MIVCGGVGAVYSKLMPKKSNDLKAFLRQQEVIPAETHDLADYNPDDSPEDVGLFISGNFCPAGQILRYREDYVCVLRKEKQRELELAAEHHR